MSIRGKETGQVADLTGNQLVDGRPGVDIGPSSLFDADASEKGAAGAGVVTWTIGTGGRVHMVHPAEHLKLMLRRRRAAPSSCSSSILSLPHWPPGVLNDPVWNVEEGHPHGCPCGGSAAFATFNPGRPSGVTTRTPAAKCRRRLLEGIGDD